MNPARSRVLPLILGLALSAGSASAATIVVAAGETGIAANGHCSLIEAMENAQTDSRVHADCVAGSGADVIRLSPGDYVLAQPLSPGSNTALPHISTPMTIQGNGSTLRRSAHPSTPPFRFMTMSAASLTLEGLTFRNARLQTTYYFDGGAVISQSGGSLLARDVRFIDNGASSNGRGGAVFIANASGGIGAHAVFEDCLFEGNFTDTLPGQHGSGGGAIWIEGGELEIERCAFIDNRTQPVDVPQAGNGGALHISDLGAEAGDVPDGLVSQVWVRNSTFSGNRADTAGGIGLQVGQGFVLSLGLEQVTLVDNRARTSAKGIGAHAGMDAGQVFIHYARSILHGNGAGANDKDCVSLGGMPRVYWESGGANLLAPDRGCTLDAFGEDFVDADPWAHIQPLLHDHGHDLKAGSPLVDALALAHCGHGQSRDQRGRLRGGGPGAGGAHCDVGAVEYYGDGDVIFAHGFD
ncbi:hypothetical protein [Pseudofulvimonas gallinarii]|jgi:hypothetical protein|uniref:CSLREA domain-containing protein n=1 Tax=Pseudofulvimonas gallinarii TaxID=634155 RepID=A0A4S3KZX7_9GAMM|nr:hypothetical protein [Pseudofulvimonas gallinarii]TCS99263.1 hypothetical protein EDC25_106101 [Pseudofulvimonas gallinarii]THD13934.1 hypothetical protein B1808_05455 [Pseudofulvimonas gallinarii]